MFGKPTSEKGVKIPGPKRESGAERIVVGKNPRQRLLDEIGALNYQIDRTGRKSGDFRVANQIQNLVSKRERLKSELVQLSNEDQPEDSGGSSF